MPKRPIGELVLGLDFADQDAALRLHYEIGFVALSRSILDLELP
jgi:hypothetical protein